MTLSHTIKLVFFSVVVIITLAAKLDSSGPSGGYSNAPSESNCTSCHSGTALQTSGGYWNNLRLTPTFKNGGYMIDSTYTIEVTFKQSGISRFGFQVTCLESATGNPAGTFTTSNNRVQKTTAFINSKTRNYVEHTYAGTSSVATDSTRWVFSWKAPSSNVGKVKFYVVVNATNSDGNLTGDVIYAKTFEYIYAGGLPVAHAATTDPVVCAGTIVHCQGTGTNSPTSYSWKFIGGGTPATSTAQNPTVTFTGSGTKLCILTVKNGVGTSAPDTVKITVNKSPTSTITGNPTITLCKGDSTVLTAGAYPGAVYAWQPFGKSGISLTVKDSGSYTVITKTPSNGCATTSSPVVVSVAPKPTVTLNHKGNSTAFCDAIMDTLSTTSTNADSFYWYNNGIFLTATKAGILPVSATSPAGYQVQAKSAAGCFSPISNSLNMTITPSLKVSNLQSTTITTSSIALRWTPPAGRLGMKYSIDSGKTYITTTTDSSQTITGLQPNTPYKILLKTLQTTPCNQYINNIVCTTLPCSNIAFKLTMDTAVCPGKPLMLSVNGLYHNNYGVSVNNKPFSKDTLFTFTPALSGSVLIKINDSANLACPSIVRTLSYQVKPAPTKGFTYTRNRGIYTFTSNDNSGMLYTWQFGAGDTSMYKTAVHDYTTKAGQSVTVILQVTNNVSCTTADTQTFSIPDLASVSMSSLLQVNTYPNPFSGTVTIDNPETLKLDCVLTDMLGHVILQTLAEEARHELPTADLAPGIYILKLSAGERSRMIKLVKE